MGWSVSSDSESTAQYYALFEHTNGIHLRVDVYTGDSASSNYDVEDGDEAVADAVALLDAAAAFTSLGTSKTYAVSETYAP